MKKILFIEICNFVDYPLGGHLSFAKHMLKSFGNQLALVGCSTDNTPVGRWITKEIDGVEYDFFSVRKVDNQQFKKPLVPLRLKHYLAVRKYRKKIFTYPIDNLFIQTPEVLFACREYLENKNTAFIFPGVENSLSISRYNFAKKIAGLYEKILFSTLLKVNKIFACADANSIKKLYERSNDKLKTKEVISFPTRFDSSIFYPKDMDLIEGKDKILIVTSGRLHWAKGWKFMIDAFQLFLKDKDAELLFLGDGDEKELISDYIKENNLEHNVKLLGSVSPNVLADYLRNADLFIMGSLVEGFSTALLEAIACGTPVCVTEFSSAKELVKDGVNGYVCENRNEALFADLMGKALLMNRKILKEVADNAAQNYSIDNMKKDLLNKWTIK